MLTHLVLDQKYPAYVCRYIFVIKDLSAVRNFHGIRRVPINHLLFLICNVSGRVEVSPPRDKQAAWSENPGGGHVPSRRGRLGYPHLFLCKVRVSTPIFVSGTVSTPILCKVRVSTPIFCVRYGYPHLFLCKVRVPTPIFAIFVNSVGLHTYFCIRYGYPQPIFVNCTGIHTYLGIHSYFCVRRGTTLLFTQLFLTGRSPSRPRRTSRVSNGKPTATSRCTAKI